MPRNTNMENQNADTLFADHIDPSFTTTETLRLILNNLEDAFLVINKNLEIVIASEHTCKKIEAYFGVSITKGMSVLQLAPPERRSGLTALYEEVFTGTERRSETRLQVNDHTIYIENIFKPARNETGEIIGAIAV